MLLSLCSISPDESLSLSLSLILSTYIADVCKRLVEARPPIAQFTDKLLLSYTLRLTIREAGTLGSNKYPNS